MLFRSVTERESWILGNKEADANLSVEGNARQVEPGYDMLPPKQKAELHAEVEAALKLWPTHGEGKWKKLLLIKDSIADMHEASSALMKLRPVTFNYKSDQDPAGRELQYGLIAEEVNETYPGLVIHGLDGQIETVKYHFLPPMLLNEFQKQQRTLQTQAARLEILERELQEIKSLLGRK